MSIYNKTNKFLSASTALKLTLSALTFKILGHLLSPTQYYVFGQVQNLFQILSAATAAIASAKFSSRISSLKEPSSQTAIIISAQHIIILIFAIQVFAVHLLHDWIIKISGISQDSWVIYTIPFAALFSGLTSLSLSILTGQGRIIDHSKYTMAIAFTSLLTTSILSVLFGLKGALISITITTFFSFIFGAINFKIKLIAPNKRQKRIKISDELNFSIFALIIGISYYTTHLYIKTNYVSHVGYNEAGLYTAASRISELYMGLASTIFASKLIPRYSKVANSKSISEIISVNIKAGPILIPAFALLFFFSEKLIGTIFSESYSAAGKHLQIIILSDVIKCIYWTIIYFIIKSRPSSTYFYIEAIGVIIFFSVATTNFFSASKFIPQSGMLSQNIFMLIAAIGVVAYNAKKDT